MIYIFYMLEALFLILKYIFGYYLGTSLTLFILIITISKYFLLLFILHKFLNLMITLIMLIFNKVIIKYKNKLIINRFNIKNILIK